MVEPIFGNNKKKSGGKAKQSSLFASEVFRKAEPVNQPTNAIEEVKQ